MYFLQVRKEQFLDGWIQEIQSYTYWRVVKILVYFDKAFNFKDLSLEYNNNVLVHCVKGVSRSGSIVISYIMRKQNISSMMHYY